MQYLQKLTSTGIALFICSMAIMAQTGNEWDDPTITSVNRETAHTLAIPMASEDEVGNNDLSTSPFYQSLDGQWKFYWVNAPSKATTALCAKDYDDSSWTTIDVPSSWQVWGLRHGKSWDKPLYCNVAYPFSFNESTYSVMASRPSWFTYNSSMPNPVGTYRRTFTLPSNWSGRDIYVRFNGVGHGYYLWVNGQSVGFSKNSRDAAGFDITRFARTGENSISVEVYRNSDGSFLEAQDMFRLPGIFRSVCVYARPKTHIQDLRVQALWDGSQGTLKIESPLNFKFKIDKGYHIAYTLYQNDLYSDKNKKLDIPQLSNTNSQTSNPIWSY